MAIKYSNIKIAIQQALGLQDDMSETKIRLQAALTAECGKAGSKVADAAFKEVRDMLCKGMTKRNETLKAASGKLTRDLDANGQLCRMHLLLSVTWANLKPTGRKNKKGARHGKATTTKVTGVAKSQVRIIASKPKKLSDTLKVILATIQATEKPDYKDVPKLVAALQTCIDLAV